MTQDGMSISERTEVAAHDRRLHEAELELAKHRRKDVPRLPLIEENDRIRELEAENARLEAHNDEVRTERDRASSMLRDSETQLRRAQGARDAARKGAWVSAAAKARDRAQEFEDAIETALGLLQEGDAANAAAVLGTAVGTDEQQARCEIAPGAGAGWFMCTTHDLDFASQAEFEEHERSVAPRDSQAPPEEA